VDRVADTLGDRAADRVTLSKGADSQARPHGKPGCVCGAVQPVNSPTPPPPTTKGRRGRGVDGLDAEQKGRRAGDGGSGDQLNTKRERCEVGI